MGGADLRKVAEWIVEALRAPEDTGRITALRGRVRELALGFPVPGIAWWRTRLRAPDRPAKEVPTFLVAEIRRFGAQAIPLLLSYLEHGEPHVRQTTAAATALYPRLSATTVPYLRRALHRESDDDTRAALRNALDTLEGARLE